MKKIKLIIFLLFPLLIFGQKINYEEYQRESFIKAEKALKNSNGLEALHYFHTVCILDVKSDIEIKAKAKIDSLLPIYQKKELEKWKGTWKLKQIKTNRFDYEKIIITEKEISFYKKEKDTTYSRNETIEHKKYDPNDLIVDIHSVEFKNKEIWEFSLKEKNNELRLFPNLKTQSDGTTWILLDERSMIRNKDDREKALAEEIRTYYTKIK
ncbi:hypothetical protein [Aurantibacter aestuarii]|uniref:Uncharacterized protein n=1 Tax=Aurantibacter aestuarii TaxID=1266046 RepID=A0A2T1N4W2_9FLAO|nr:hypothetical protein [Aurantibacter aestuarii]PSG86070.1 hypothetical protein C7H52_13050 [Aurantibacter aestuarii]